jgi:hypothetical protein
VQGIHISSPTHTHGSTIQVLDLLYS